MSQVALAATLTSVLFVAAQACAQKPPFDPDSAPFGRIVINGQSYRLPPTSLSLLGNGKTIRVLPSVEKTEGTSPNPKGLFEQNDVTYASDQVLVKFYENVTEAQVQELLHSEGLVSHLNIKSMTCSPQTVPQGK